MASRARQGAEVARWAGEDEGARPFSTVLRIVVLAALLLLCVYTMVALARGPTAAAPGGSAAASVLTAERLAGRAGELASTLKLAASAGASVATSADAAALALRVGAPDVMAATVVDTSGVVLAQAGEPAAAAAFRQAALLRGSKSAAWFGVPTARSGPWLVAGASAADGRRVLVAAPATLLFPGQGGAAHAFVSTPEGLILAADGPTPFTAESLLGLAPADLLAAARDGRSLRGLLGPGQPVDVGVATNADATLLSVVATPAPPLAAVGRGRAVHVVELLFPLVLGVLLTLVLLRQTRRAETARRDSRESERKFRLAVEAARCGIWEWDLAEDRVAMSDVTGAMFGWGGGGIADGEDVIARIAPEHRDRMRQALRGAADYGAVDVSFCVPRAAGGDAWIDARGQAFGGAADGGSGRYGRVIGVALDVTEERNAEHRAQAAERRLHDAIDSVSEAFVLWDRQGRLLMCNGAFREAFALEPRAVKPGAARAAVLKLAELAVRAHSPVANPARPGLREVETVEGRWLQVSERRTAEGGLVMTAADITGLKRQEEARRLNEEALQNAVARLEDSRRELSDLAQKYQAEKFRAEGANSAKSEFLANMSHELRTPLNAVNGFSEMMVGEMFGPLGDRRYKEYARDILSSGQHLLALINDILDMSKIEAGKMNLHLEAVQVGELASEAARLMRNRAESAGLILTVAADEDLPAVEADFRALKQILLNLLSNAIKFTPQGGRVTVRATMVVGATGPGVRVAVVDTGIGIAADDIGRLARPFEQIETQHSKTQQGTGLGLALTKSLVELHEGVLAIESEPGRGTTVSFVLPAGAEGRTAGPAKISLDLGTAVILG